MWKLKRVRVTYLHRTQPHAPATTVLSPVQLDVLKARSSKLSKVFTVAWAVEAVARLGGYLEHRRQTPIGIQVLGAGLATIGNSMSGLATSAQRLSAQVSFCLSGLKTQAALLLLDMSVLILLVV